jgi:hypothetical protein
LRIADCGLRVADLAGFRIANQQSAISNQQSAISNLNWD